MANAETDLLLLRYWLRDEFTGRVAAACNMSARHCRGGSKILYDLILKSPATYQYMKTDKDHLQVLSGLGHTFIRYKDDKHGRYIYIDPTIAQFVPSFDGIFVGTAEELMTLTAEPGSRLNITDYIEDPKWTGKTHPPLTLENTLMKGGTRVGPGSLIVAVESGDLDEVKRVGNTMSSEGWTVNWHRHAQTAKNAAIRNYLTRKAAENTRSAAALMKGGGPSLKRSIRKRRHITKRNATKRNATRRPSRY